MNNDETDLILAEYARFSESFWNNEEVGEKRVNYFLGLMTAAYGGLVALATSDFASGYTVYALAIATGAQAALFAVGMVTRLRILRRDAVTTEYRNILDTLRKEYVARVGSAPYELPFLKTNERGPSRGGLKTMMYALNAIVAIGFAVTATALLWVM